MVSKASWYINCQGANQPCLLLFSIRLQSINLCENEITEIPPGVGELRCLINFDICENRIETLPESLGALENLRTLDLRNNRITSLPESMSRLTNLITLDCAGNEIVDIPQDLRDIKGLRVIHFYTENGIFSNFTSLYVIITGLSSYLRRAWWLL